MFVAFDVWGREIWQFEDAEGAYFEARHDGVTEMTVRHPDGLGGVLWSLSGAQPGWYVPPVEA